MQPPYTPLPQRYLSLPLSSNATFLYPSPTTQLVYNYLPQRTFHTSLFSNVNSYLNLGVLTLLRLFTAYSYFMQMVRMKMFIKIWLYE